MENHKILIAIPIILALLSLVLIGFNGLEQGVDLKGGSLAELQLLGSVTPSELEDTLDAKLNTNIQVMETIRLLWNWKTISIQVHLQAP